MAGADDAEVPPVPIPNTEVKLCCAEDTWLETTWENRQAPAFLFAFWSSNGSAAARTTSGKVEQFCKTGNLITCTSSSVGRATVKLYDH